MFDITHQKARMLLQSAADRQIAPDETSALNAHLEKCKECRDYANDLTNLEAGLRNALHAQWDHQQPKLDLQAITNPTLAKLMWVNFPSLTQSIGKVTIVTVLLLGYFMLANHFGIRIHSSNSETPANLPTPNELLLLSNTSPTPSAPTQLTTMTKLTMQDCDVITYIVQATDSLESIAIKHGTSKELIMEYNNLTTEAVSPDMELFIPLCRNTPSRTASLPSNLITNTPIKGTILPDNPE
jgi:LysM repeat protein